MSRADMERTIQNGGTVLHGGVLIERIEDIPDGLELARDNPEQFQAEKDAMQRRIDDLQAKLEQARNYTDDMGASIPSEGLDDAVINEPLDYESLSRSALLVIARDRGLPLEAKMSKDAILNLLKENHEATQAAQGDSVPQETPAEQAGP